MSDVSPSISSILSRISTRDGLLSPKKESETIKQQMLMLQRRLEDLEKKKEPYENQDIAAKHILHNFLTTKIHYCLLRANEQVGKTGTYHTLIRLMLENNLVDNVYILCGSHELELLNQCIKDHQEWHNDAIYKDKIHIIFRQHFKKVTMNTARCLIIIDESHLVEGAEQTLSKFLEKHKLSMAGTLPSMITNKTYMVSVDATPYAEESAIEYKLSQPKFKVTLEDGEGYFGVKEYYEAGLIHPTFELSTVGGYYHFKQLIMRCPKKYVLVRIAGQNKQKKWLIKWAQEMNCEVLHFTSHYDKSKTQITVTKEDALQYKKKYGIIIPSLDQQPDKTTVVIIDGRLRCGKRVPKKYIGLIWEATKEGKTDIVRQGLLGRMCGYQGDDDYSVPTENKPLIFIPNRILKKAEKKKVIEMSDLERSIYPSSDKTIIGPRLANNIIPGLVQTKAERNGFELTPCVPIRFHLNAGQSASLMASSDNDIKNYCLNTLMDRLTPLITNNANFTSEQKNEIMLRLSVLTTEACHIRHYKGVSNQNMYKRHIEGYLNGTASKEHITDFPFLTFCVVHSNFVKPEGVSRPILPGEVYAIFYTFAKGYIWTIDKESRISKVNTDTHFTIQPTSDLLECPAGAIYGFSPKILIDSSEFFKQLDYFIKIAKEGIGIFSKRLTSLHSGEYIVLPRSVYGDSLEILKTIFADIESKHSVKITYEVRRKRPVSSEACSSIIDHEIKYISWE